MNKRLWILGASDPEMAAIERLLLDCGETVEHATVDGVRVHPGNAYSERVDPVCADGYLHSNIYSVECAAHYEIYGDSFSVDVGNRVDHHRPGDSGYGKPPAEYWRSSSLGQVIDRLHQLNVETLDVMALSVPDHKLICAADHCLAHAYRGECPGVDPDDLMRWRVASRAKFQCRSEEEILADIESAREILKTSVGDSSYADLRDQHIPELPEAAAREGIAYVSSVTDRDGRQKIVLGAAEPDLVSQFLAGDLPCSSLLVDIYGDPARGFAGGHVA